MPSARTSVANKEYEGKKAEKRDAAQLQQRVNRRGAVHDGDAGLDVALRHGVNV